ncbi:MAG: BatD family protein, partial [Verrucomicrobiia bacterium]
MESRLTPETVAVGEPVTWSLTLRGTGNWPANFDFPTRRVPGSMRIIEPEVKRDSSPEKPFEATATQDIVIIPREPGTFDIPPIQFSFFNPTTGDYETLVTEPAQLIVTGDQPGGTLTTLPKISPPPTGDRPPLSQQPPPEPGPTALPRDPLPGTGTTLRPLPSSLLLTLGAGLLLAILPCWTLLARRETIQRHPHHAARLAWNQAQAALRSIAQDSPHLSHHLLQWQQAIARSQNLHLACPTLPQLAATPLFSNPAWTDLWTQAEASLYGNVPLPDDWIQRAQTAAAAYRPASVPWAATLRPAHWFPALTLLLLTPHLASADPGADAYRSGDFAAARAAWNAQLQAQPGDWVARNNLGLALAQEGHWDRATAEWARAWLAAPRHSDLQWNLTLGLGKASFQAPELRRLTADRWENRLTTLLAPGAWQMVFLSGTFLLALGTILFLLGRYTQRPRLTRLALPSALLASLLILAATLALAHYGPLADPNVALIVETTPLKSIPTDAPVNQANKPAPAGLLVHTGPTFLGWT